jgi:AcrR family transcriptional regulator
MTGENPEVDLPRGVALAWGVAANPQRGPKRELSIERIVEAAVQIADADGLAAVSMSSVAAALGFTTMSLYRYVSAKDDLILLMQEYGTGLPPQEIAEATGWRDGLTRWSRGSRDAYRAHAWLIEIPITGTPNTPNNLAWMDVALGVLQDTPLTDNERVGALLMVTGHTRWQATVERGYTATTQKAGITQQELDRAQSQMIASLVSPEAFPYLAPAIAAGVLEDDDDPFEFGLQRLLDGMAAYMQARETGAPPVTGSVPVEADSFPRDPAVKEARAARREAEKALREAQKREREAMKRAVERAAKQ